ncbi:glycerophosphodiester phosphodiesterase family protein [Desulfurobacterium sp. TC5-1]|uniref:glycerophosphodiester phosphodiesterase family protein n=1 Tax=Desulfurobacterium sp. TC5-1 TaxID=1158318 RepID=UPI0003B4B9A7|nr:glycerophosphodiester phosphodiesterase family protein [Desulfurobacterium sp. TC5-1]
MKIIAHRGASFYAPENTFSAFNLAFKMGADGIEMDVRLSKDGEIVVIHDETTGRTGNKSLTVSEALYSQLEKVDVGSYFDREFKGEKIPRLRDVMVAFPDKELYIEIKTGKEIIPYFLSLSREILFSKNFLFFSFDFEVVKTLKRFFPENRVLFVVDYGYNVPDREGVCAAIALAVKGASLDGVSTCADLRHGKKAAEVFKSAGLFWNVWTVDNPYLAKEFKALGVDSISTNRPDLIAAYVK